MSFGWRVGQPIDPAAGLRACQIARSGDLWRANNGTYSTQFRFIKQVAWRKRYLDNPDQPTRCYIEHPTLGRIAAPALPFNPTAQKPKRADALKASLTALQNLLWAIEGNPRAIPIDEAFANARALVKAA